MRSWLRHRAGTPLHALRALLALLPTALLLGGTAFDLAALAFDRSLWWVAGAHLLTAGIATGALAAVPGAIDHFALPAHSLRRRRSRTHGLLSLVALALFALARWVRGHPEVPPDPPILAAQALAGLLVLIATVQRTRLAVRDGVGVVAGMDAEKGRE